MAFILSQTSDFYRKSDTFKRRQNLRSWSDTSCVIQLVGLPVDTKCMGERMWFQRTFLQMGGEQYGTWLARKRTLTYMRDCSRQSRYGSEGSYPVNLDHYEQISSLRRQLWPEFIFPVNLLTGGKLISFSFDKFQEQSFAFIFPNTAIIPVRDARQRARSIFLSERVLSLWFYSKNLLCRVPRRLLRQPHSTGAPSDRARAHTVCLQHASPWTDSDGRR